MHWLKIQMLLEFLLFVTSSPSQGTFWSGWSCARNPYFTKTDNPTFTTTLHSNCQVCWGVKVGLFFSFLIQLPLSVWRYDQVHHHGMLPKSKGNGNVHHYAHLYNSTRLTLLSDDSLFTQSSAVAFRTNFFSQDRNLTVTGLNAL